MSAAEEKLKRQQTPSGQLLPPVPATLRSPIMATELESVLPVLRGMEKGYALSPMADLERDYTSSSDKETSLFQRATMIASSKGLASSSVMDRGLSSRGRPVARFSLETGFRILTEKTVKDMDTLLRNAVRLLPQRNSHFIVDPNTTFLTVLKSAGDLNELVVAWNALGERMRLAQKSFLKYQSEYRAVKQENIL